MEKFHQKACIVLFVYSFCLNILSRESDGKVLLDKTTPLIRATSTVSSLVVSLDKALNAIASTFE